MISRSTHKGLSECQEKGIRQLVWLPYHIFKMTEKVRKNLGMKKSEFYRFAIMYYLQNEGILSKEAKRGLNG